MSLTNAQPRFGVEADTDTVFCYLTNRHLKPEGQAKLPDGTWDMAKVKALILAGKPVTAALVKPAIDETDKVSQADKDFAAEVDAKIAAEAKAKADAEAAGNPTP